MDVARVCAGNDPVDGEQPGSLDRARRGVDDVAAGRAGASSRAEPAAAAGADPRRPRAGGAGASGSAGAGERAGCVCRHRHRRPHRRVEPAGGDSVRLVGARGDRPAPDRHHHSARSARASPGCPEHVRDARGARPARQASGVAGALSRWQRSFRRAVDRADRRAHRAALRRLTARHHAGAPAVGRDPPADRDTGAARCRAHGATRSREPRAVDGESRPGGIRIQRLARSARAAACDRRARHAVSRSGRPRPPTRSAITRERSVATSRTWASSSTIC